MLPGGEINSGQVGSVLSKRLLLVDFLGSDFRSMKIRGKNPDCTVCGKDGSLTHDNLSAYDYIGFTGQHFTEDPTSTALCLLNPSDRLSPAEFAVRLKQKERNPFVLIDVRPRPEFDICHFKGSLTRQSKG